MIFGGLLLAGISIKGRAQDSTPADSTQKTLRRLADSKDPLSKDTLRQMLVPLAASDKEEDMTLAGRYYYQLSDKKISDSIFAVLPVKFPRGKAARNNAERVIYDEKDPVKKEQLYDQWTKKFPSSAYPDHDHDHIIYDYARIDLATSFARQNNVAEAAAWIGKMEENFYKGNGYGGLAEAFIKAGNLSMAEKYMKKAMLSAQIYYNDSTSKDNAVRFAGSGYPGLMTSYVKILVDEKKYEVALPWAKKALTLQKEPSPLLAFSYALLLKHVHRYSEAFAGLEAVVKEGQATPEMVDTFKVLYVRVKGSDAGYAAYAEAIHKGFLESLHKRLVKDKLNTPAPGFTLTDVNGKPVSLSDYRGKTIVLDFWATWCGPCKASFPSMKKVLEKYKGDTSVQFLFVHTWEKDSAAEATAKAKDFIETNHYPFEVLMDLKDSATGANKVVESYKVSGIPTKFVIDKQGVIRFKFTGFSGGEDAAVEEVSTMIEMARG